MKALRQHKILIFLLIFSFVGHITLIHSYVEDLVLCVSYDGEVKLEQVNGADECSPELQLTTAGSVTGEFFSTNDCEDIPLESFCTNDEQTLPKNSFSVVKFSLPEISIKIADFERKTFRITQKQTVINTSLDNFTSVLLLI